MIMDVDLREIATVGMVLFAVIDILGSIPIIVDLRTKVGHIQSEKATIVAMIFRSVFPCFRNDFRYSFI
jgi:multiple antibiotic resistance protein